MRVYVSSTFEDLKEHRAAAIQVLRQLGHDVIAMEDYVAENAIPLNKCLEDVKSCDFIVEIVAWRYGYVPATGPDDIEGATPGETSITEYEFCQAIAAGKTALVFLLEERAPWPAHFIDGVRDPGVSVSHIREFRARLQQQKLVGWFNSPDSLASRVAAAVGTVGMREEVNRQLIRPFSPQMLGPFTTPGYLTDSHTMPLIDLVAAPVPAKAVAIDVSTTWWSTRLYLLAAVGEELGDLRRIIILDDDQFVGMVSTTSVRLALRRIHPQADRFEKHVLTRSPGADVRDTARKYLEVEWNKILRAKPGDVSSPEASIVYLVNAPNLRLWFGESLLETPVHVDDLSSISAIDLLRILDFPNDFVPVVSFQKSDEVPIQLVNKKDLTERLSRNAIVEMLDRLGVR